MNWKTRLTFLPASHILFFKSNWITDVNERKDAKRKLKYLLLDVSSPMTDKSSVSILEDFLNKDIKPLTS